MFTRGTVSRIEGSPGASVLGEAGGVLHESRPPECPTALVNLRNPVFGSRFLDSDHLQNIREEPGPRGRAGTLAFMDDQRPFQPRPAEFKGAMDGLAGLVRIPLVGGLHEGRELYIDETEVPDEIWTTPRREPFEWWPARVREAMAQSALGSDPAAPPVRYVLRVDESSREPRFVAEDSPTEDGAV